MTSPIELFSLLPQGSVHILQSRSPLPRARLLGFEAHDNKVAPAGILGKATVILLNSRRTVCPHLFIIHQCM